MRSLVIVACASCAVLPRSLDLPPNDQTTVALLTGTLGPPLDDLARHPWFAVRRRGASTWDTYEVGGGGSEDDPFRHHHYYGSPILHGLWRGDEAERGAACIERVAPRIEDDIEAHYIMYPGPNSNSFGERVLKACGLHASLPATAIGKDWHVLYAGVTTEGTGLQIETPLLGVKAGLKEGVEVHVIGLTFGIDLWPPAILVPFGSGRIGFADR